MTLSELKDLADAVSGFATALGIFVAGVWTYLLFVRNREKYPAAKLSQETHQYRLNSRVSILRVAIKIENAGKVLLPMREMECRLLQVLPLAGSLVGKMERPDTLVEPGAQRISWPMLDCRTCSFPKGRAELEPGETEIVRCDFVVQTAVDVVQVYSHLRNPTKEAVGWSCLSQVEIIWQENANAQTTVPT